MIALRWGAFCAAFIALCAGIGALENGIHGAAIAALVGAAWVLLLTVAGVAVLVLRIRNASRREWVASLDREDSGRDPDLGYRYYPVAPPVWAPQVTDEQGPE